MSKQKPAKEKPSSVAEREARQAAKLRENLRRRKDQSRQRQSPKETKDNPAEERVKREQSE